MKLSKKAILMYALLMMAGFSFAACNSNGNSKPSGGADMAKNTGSAASEQSQPDVSFTDENGKTVSLASLKGKVVFINFWATWCPPCREEMPAINQLRQSFKGNDNIVFLMVNVDGTIKKSKAFMEKNKYDLPVYVPNSEIPGSFLGNAIPTTVILDKSGKMAARMEGGRDYASPEVKDAMDKLINGN